MKKPNNKRRSMTEISLDVAKNNKSRPSRKQVDGLFDTLEKAGLTEPSKTQKVENNKKRVARSRTPETQV
jgi:hypothetical protein